ncbi:MAG: hypothetical protein U9Q04_09005 [Campylobacterota bacterium]|nr:hypothetical protein [Campylobacterota bacterium]
MYFNEDIVKRIEKLNDNLRKVEEKAYNLAKKENQDALKKVLEKQNGICNYDLNIKFDFYIRAYSVLELNEDMKFAFLKDKKIGYLNDKDDHSIKLPSLKPLDYQKHCWLLHSLYDDHMVPWELIHRIDKVYFNIEVSFEYESEL